MAIILIGGSDAAFMQSLPETLAADLAQRGLAQDLQLSALDTRIQAPVRGVDPASWMTLAITAAGAGGALTVLLGKDGFLAALARVLEKYVESRKAEIRIKTEDGREIELRGPVGNIEKILRDLTRNTSDQGR